MSKKGFTLIEMLLVLSIIMMSSLLSLSMNTSISDNKQLELMTHYFELARMNALTYKEETTVNVSNHYLRIHSSHFNKSISLDSHSYFQTIHTFHYNANGRIKTAKTLKFISNGHLYEFVFQLGSGTFYVRE